jgi:heme/copper-type cytochrome/quinol oxidase subunit 3
VLFEFYLVGAAGAIFTIGAFIQWLWPSEERLALVRNSGVDRVAGVPVFAMGTRSPMWWGMACTVAVAGTVIATLVYCYFYLRLFSPEWPQNGLPQPRLTVPSLTFGLLILSGMTQWLAKRSIFSGIRKRAGIALGLTLGLGVAFLLLHIYGLSGVPFSHRTNAYGSVFLVTAWILNVLVIVALGLQLAAQLRLRRNFDDRTGFMGVQIQITAMFWYFIVAAGSVVYLVLYVSPHLL